MRLLSALALSVSVGLLTAGGQEKKDPPTDARAEKLKEITPVPTSKVFFCNSGSEANDSQVKLIWYMNNAVFVSGAFGPTLPPGWSLVAP